MKIAVILMSGISILLIVSTLICGLWIISRGSHIADLAGSTNFHKMLAIGTACSTIATLVLAMARKEKMEMRDQNSREINSLQIFKCFAG